MATIQIELDSGKGCYVSRVFPDRASAMRREHVRWNVHNRCDEEHTVDLQGLDPYVTGTRPVTVLPGHVGRIDGTAGATTGAFKYDVLLDGSLALDPYIVIQDPGVVDPVARVLAILAGIGVGYLTYRSVESLINESLSSKKLTR